MVINADDEQFKLMELYTVVDTQVARRIEE